LAIAASGVAVDSASARQSVQAALPQWVVNAWTQPGDLGLSRHGFVDDQACLMCLYLPDGPRPHLSQLVTDAVGFLPEHGAPQERLVRDLLASGRPVGREFLTQVAQTRGIPLEPLLVWENQPLRAFYAEAVCGGVVSALGGGQPASDAARVHVPMAFQSAFAGILLAAHLVAEAAGIPVAVSTKTSINLLAPLGSLPLSRPHKKPTQPRCICQDGDYLAAYRAKYGTRAA
jgi:hypothetical protein